MIIIRELSPGDQARIKCGGHRWHHNCTKNATYVRDPGAGFYYYCTTGLASLLIERDLDKTNRTTTQDRPCCLQ